MTWHVNILTLFPQLFPGPLAHSVIGRAREENAWDLNVRDIRDYATDKYRTVDDTVYGGGSGMVLKPDILASAIDNCFDNEYDIIYLSPRGKLLNQSISREYSQKKGLNIICGRFEGIDERIFLEYSIQEVSIGDYVLTSGDIAAYILLDACIRQLPGVIEDTEALSQESFGIGAGYENLLEYPQYTKPSEWRGHKVPEVLLSGNHKNIKEWRKEQAIAKTRQVRPELLDLCSK